MTDQPLRIGFGSDLHRLEAGDGFMLGGQHIPCSLSSVAHSDGDVLLHACVDALLGACGKGDIGELFPDTNEENRNRNSKDFLHEAIQIVNDEGWVIVNIDCNIHLQKPKIMPLKKTIRENLAKYCRLDTSRVNIKAKTGEEVDAIGKSKAVKAEVIVLLGKSENT